MSNPDKIIMRTLLLDGGDKMGLGGEIFAEGGYFDVMKSQSLTHRIGKLGWVQNLREALPA